MAHEEPVDPLAEVDALLRDELSRQPSPAFLPRVRDAVAHERPAPRRWWLWTLAPLAAAATLTVVLWPADRIAPAADAAAIEARTANREPRTPNPEPRATNPEPRTTNLEQRTSNNEQRTTDSGAPSAEVLVDERQRAALSHFIALIDKGVMTSDAFAGTTAPPAAIRDTVVTIEVAPVTVSPIEGGGVLPSDERK